MAVTAALIKELREKTNVGMSDCKNALVEADGNIGKAIELLREKGLSAAANKAERIATEGLVHSFISDDNKIAVILEVNSETDFVAINQGFKDFVGDICNQVVCSSNSEMDLFMNEKWLLEKEISVADALSQKIAVIGENITIRRFTKYENSGNDVLVSYIHGGGKVAAILKLETTASYAEIAEAGKNICMQIAAMNPTFLSKDEVDAEYLQKEREILTEQAESEGKPKQIIEKMIEGRLSKKLKEVCLLEQEYVKDADFTIATYMESVSKIIGKTIIAKAFTRYEVGEGLEKKEENFADEVNKVMQR